MKNHRFRYLLTFAALAVALPAVAQAEEQVSTIAFSKPDQPGTLKVILAHGDLRVQGSDAKEISVRSESKAVTKTVRKDGLRVLTASSSFALSEKDNTVTLDAMSEGWGGGASDFRLTVPRGTALVVQSSWGGDIRCADIAGDIEIKSTNGEVSLDGVSGGVLVETVNGEIHANVREVREGKALSFTSTNGEVVLRVPPAAKANVRLRTQNGAVLTDFDDKALVTKTENTSRNVSVRRTRTFTGLPPEARKAIADSVRMAAQIGREISEATREGIESSQMREQAARMHADAARQQAEVEAGRAAQYAAPPAPAAAPTPAAAPAASPVPAIAPMPPAIPTITGGKLVTGTLNGGGPEISISTMNGDVTLRQAEKK